MKHGSGHQAQLNWNQHAPYDNPRSNLGRLSGLVSLLPFIEQQPLWEKISNPYLVTATNVTIPSMGPAPWFDANQYRPWATRIGTYRCPSEPAEYKGWGPTQTNYLFCVGDTYWNIRGDGGSKNTARGAFIAYNFLGFRDIQDGLSNTIVMGESANDNGTREVKGTYQVQMRTPEVGLNPKANCRDIAVDPLRPLYYKLNYGNQFAANNLHPEGKGAWWNDGGAGIQGVCTVFPPNGPSCSFDHDDGQHGLFAVTSRHRGGAHVLMGDGAVRFTTENVDSGNLNSPCVGNNGAGGYLPNGSESPYGVWGAAGSKSANENRTL
jgi:prepilin-type processing-associated H-X9-DG protein